jgi:hypothetical protein
MSVQDYYQELQKGMLRCGVEEDDEDKMVRFYGVSTQKFRTSLTTKIIILFNVCSI